MKTNERALLAACIDTGIYAGWTRAHKHTDTPHELRIQEEIDSAIWYEIDQYFVFDSERDLCDEVAEGFDELQNTRHVCQLTPGSLHLKDHEASQKTGRYVCICENWEQEEHTSDEPRDGEIRAVNYPIRTAEEGQLVFKHRLEQYYSGEWREIRVYQEDEDGNLSARETDRLRAKKKQIYEDLKDAVDRKWVGLTDDERCQIHNDFIHKKIGIWEVCEFCEAKLKEKNHD